MEDPRETLDILYQQQLDIMTTLRRKLEALPEGDPATERFVRIARQMQTQVDAFRAEKEGFAAEYAMAVSEALQRALDAPPGSDPGSDPHRGPDIEHESVSGPESES